MPKKFCHYGEWANKGHRSCPGNTEMWLHESLSELNLWPTNWKQNSTNAHRFAKGVETIYYPIAFTHSIPPPHHPHHPQSHRILANTLLVFDPRRSEVFCLFYGAQGNACTHPLIYEEYIKSLDGPGLSFVCCNTYYARPLIGPHWCECRSSQFKDNMKI